MADRDALRLNDKSRQRAGATLGENIVEQHRVDAADHQIAVWMDVVVIRDRVDAELALGAQQYFVGDRAAQGADPPAAQIGERAPARRVAVAHAQHFAKAVIGHRRRHGRAPRRRVFDAAQADLGVAALDGLVDRRESDVDKTRLASEPAGDELGDFDVETDELVRLRGIRFDERRAAFRIAGPAEFAGRFAAGSAPKGGNINVVNAARQATRSGPWARTILLERDKAVEKIDPKLVLRRDQKEAKVVILIATKFS